MNCINKLIKNVILVITLLNEVNVVTQVYWNNAYQSIGSTTSMKIEETMTGRWMIRLKACTSAGPGPFTDQVEVPPKSTPGGIVLMQMLQIELDRVGPWECFALWMIWLDCLNCLAKDLLQLYAFAFYFYFKTSVNVVIFAGGKFRENIGKTFHMVVIFTILLLFPS